MKRYLVLLLCTCALHVVYSQQHDTGDSMYVDKPYPSLYIPPYTIASYYRNNHISSKQFSTSSLRWSTTFRENDGLQDNFLGFLLGFVYENALNIYDPSWCENASYFSNQKKMSTAYNTYQERCIFFPTTVGNSDGYHLGGL